MSDQQLADIIPILPGQNEIELEGESLSKEKEYLDDINVDTPKKEKNHHYSLDSQIKKNLNCLDEVMFSNHTTTKPRSTSINMNLIEGIREHEKINSSEDVVNNKLSKPALEGFAEMQVSVNCFPECLPTVQLCSEGISTSVENDGDAENNNLSSPPKYQQRLEHEYIPYQSNKFMHNIEEMQEQDTSEQQNKRKSKLLMIQLPSSKPTHRQGNFYNFMDTSPIKEIQSDNSSYRENFLQTSQPAGFLQSSVTNGYDTVEALQNDERTKQYLKYQKGGQQGLIFQEAWREGRDIFRFTKKFQSNCPIKSPTIPKIKKKHNDHSSQQGSLSSPMKDSLDKIKDSTTSFFKDSQQLSQNIDVSQKPIESLTGISQEEMIKKDDDIIEEQLCDPKQIEREAVPINKDALQYGLTDIRSVRNYKVNAFRNRLNLQSQQQSNMEGDRNGSQLFIPLMNEPVSLMEMQKNQNYNTVETPIGGAGQRTMQRPRLSVPPLMPLGRPGHIQEPTEKQIGFTSAIQEEEGTSQVDVDAPSKRKFQRQLLRIKVDPENSYNKREENTETWDEVVSSDQGPAETILEPKARQGSSNFEDQYNIINQRPLGEGTSGCVYQCVKTTDDDTIYAVKVMRNVDEEMSKSIFQTFGIQYRLQHESISRVYEVYYNENSQTVHYVMEYIPFRSLDSLLRDKKRTLKETDSSCIVQKLLKAVCYMEQRGVCHRDLKPENILISEDLMQIKIIDFGISKSFVKSQRVQHFTQYFKHKMYTPTGTPSYKAPEILQGAGYTQLIDMWDVGVITYQLICKGKHPFKCSSQLEQDQRIMTQNYDQSDEYWIKASINAKNFIKQLLRLNRYPAFEALKHPWIEQRKIDVADDDNNRNAVNLEKKQSSNTMTTSVPVHFQPRLFNAFNITVTNSEQNQRSGNGENDQNQNQNADNPSNEFDSPKGNINAVVTTNINERQCNEDGSSVSSSNASATPETTTKKSNFGKMNIENTPKPGLRKKHSIQSFSSTQDVVHVVMRQKLSESREKMMQFFFKANSIIKNLEEEQLKLEQNSHPGKTLKRTHSMEKQSDQPNSPHNSAAPFIGIDGLSLLSSVNSNSRINSPSVGGHPNSSHSQEDIQRSAGSSAGTPNAVPAMQTSFHMSIFSKEVQSSFTSNKNGSQNVIQNLNNHQNLDNSNTQSEGEKFTSSQLMQMPDFNSMKFSSLIARKNSQQQQQQQQAQQGVNSRKSKVIQRRNSTLQTNSMEKSIIFIKEVIGELQETFSKEQMQRGENTPSKKMKINEYADLLKINSHDNPGKEGEEDRTKPLRMNFQFFSQHQQPNVEAHDTNQSNQDKTKNPVEEINQQKLLERAIGNQGLSEKDQEKWKLIAENMEKSDSDSESSDNASQDESSSDSGSSSNSDSSEDRTQSFELDKFLIKQPDQLIEAEQSDIDPQKPILNLVDNPQQSNVESLDNKLGNKSKDSLTNIPLGFNTSSQSKPCSLTFSDAKNIGKSGQGIFQSVPYVNYMNSSKDNIINKSLIELQGHKDDRHQQPAIVMNTSSASSKENAHIHNHSAELSQKQQNHQVSQFHHSNSLAQMKSHNHKHHHHTKNSKKNLKNKESDTQINQVNLPLVTEQAQNQVNQNTSQASSNINQTISSNCSSCGLPNSMTLQDQKIQENGNDERLFKNKLPPIPKRGSNEISFNDSMGDQNLSFIEMNQSKLVQSFYPNSEDQLPINHSVKKANYLLGMNISQTSSITAGNISLSNSGNNNTIRSFHGTALGNIGSGLMTNGQVDLTGGIQSAKERGNNNTSKFKWQQSEQNSSSGGSNSQFKKGGKMDFDMSVSEQVSQGDFPLQISQKPFLDNSVFNSSCDATPSKKGQLLKQQPSSNENAQSESNSQSDNSNNTKNSLPVPVGESKPTSQDSSSSLCSSPQKHKQSGSQTGIIETYNIPASSKENSFLGEEEESNKVVENEIKNIPLLQKNERKKSKSRSPKNDSPAGIRHAGFRPTFYQQQYNKQTSNYSTIIEESGETRSCLTSSLAASSKYEFDGTSTTSMGLKINQTYSLTQINQSILERNENNTQSVSINFYPPPHINHQNSLPAGHIQIVHSCDDPDTPTEDKLLSNGLNNSPFRRAISVSVKKLAAAGNKNKTKYPSGSRPISILGSLSNSKPYSPKITQSQVSQHSLDDFFGTMQKSAFFEEDQQQSAISQESHHHFQGGPLTSIEEQEILEIIPQERHYSEPASLSEQPPLLKHRKSSLKGSLSKENFFEKIAEIIKQNPDIPSTNNEQYNLDQ